MKWSAVEIFDRVIGPFMKVLLGVTAGLALLTFGSIIYEIWWR